MGYGLDSIWSSMVGFNQNLMPMLPKQILTHQPMQTQVQNEQPTVPNFLQLLRNGQSARAGLQLRF